MGCTVQSVMSHLHKALGIFSVSSMPCILKGEEMPLAVYCMSDGKGGASGHTEGPSVPRPSSHKDEREGDLELLHVWVGGWWGKPAG